ncbi:MAG: DUF4831 family protein [Bacteroidales bacterium]|jgi:hypothetical protein|nr:DUF4831 family protein [Bacteroidales bacterium]
MKRTFLFVAGLLAVTGGYAQRKDGTAVNPNMSVVYSLPRTGIRIHVKATHEKFYAGPYQPYADMMLGIKNTLAADRDNWTIDAVRIETFCEPDPEQVRKAKGTGVMVALTPLGTLAGVNVPASIAAGSMPVAPVTTSNFPSTAALPEIPFPDLSDNPFVARPDSGASTRLTVKSAEQKAMDAAEAIIKLRQRRFDALTNYSDETLPDGRAYETLAAELGKLEAAYLSLFIGKTVREQHEYSFDWVPGSQPATYVAFRFNETKGILPASDVSGRPINIEMAKIENLAAAQAKMSDVQTNNSGVFYRIPGVAEIRVLNGVTLMAAARSEIAQFGTVVALPDELLDAAHGVLFHPETGSIKQIFQNK